MPSKYIDRCQELEDAELSIRGNQLTAENYAELLLLYLVQQRIVEARLCYRRASAKYNDEVLKELWTLGNKVSETKFGEAIKKCRTLNVGEELQPYVVELKKRLIAIQLELVSKCYSSIEKTNLAALLGLVDDANGAIIDEEEAKEIFTALFDASKFGWSSTDKGVYITPTSIAPNFALTLSTLVDVDTFGPIHRHKNTEKSMKSTQPLDASNIAELRNLIACNDFFDTKN